MPIHLLVPGLLGPWSDPSLQQPLPEFPLLEQLLARADKRPAPTDYPHTLFSLLDMPFQSPGSLPTASLCWLADTGQPVPANLLHADPIYMKADLHDVQLFRPLNLDLEQANAYANVFNDFYQHEGICLHTPTADRWYISTPVPVKTPDTSLDQVAGRNLRPFIAPGQVGREWSGLFTDIQMLFHDQPVNQTRQAGGELPVSGVWLSGGGDPPAVGSHGLTATQGDEPLLRGMALYAGLPREDAMPTANGNTLVVRQGCLKAWAAMDYPAWLEAVQQVERFLEKWIHSANGVILYPCNGQAWHWHTRSKYWFWRRKRKLSHYTIMH